MSPPCCARVGRDPAARSVGYPVLPLLASEVPRVTGEPGRTRAVDTRWHRAGEVLQGRLEGCAPPVVLLARGVPDGGVHRAHVQLVGHRVDVARDGPVPAGDRSAPLQGHRQIRVAEQVDPEVLPRRAVVEVAGELDITATTV